MTDHRYSEIYMNHLKDRTQITSAEKWLEDFDIDLMIQLEKYQIKNPAVYPRRMFTERLVLIY